MSSITFNKIRIRVHGQNVSHITTCCLCKINIPWHGITYIRSTGFVFHKERFQVLVPSSVEKRWKCILFSKINLA